MYSVQEPTRTATALIEPVKDARKKWHISGSLVAAAKPSIRRLLDRLAALKAACSEAKIICRLPIPRYVAGRCCEDQHHAPIENLTVRSVILSSFL